MRMLETEGGASAAFAPIVSTRVEIDCSAAIRAARSASSPERSVESPRASGELARGGRLASARAVGLGLGRGSSGLVAGGQTCSTWTGPAGAASFFAAAGEVPPCCATAGHEADSAAPTNHAESLPSLRG